MPSPRPLAEKTPSWIPLGLLFGLLSTASIALFAPIGVSTTYPRAVGELLRLVPGYSSPYLDQIGRITRPETMIVVGLLIGGFLAHRLSKQPVAEAGALHPFEKTPKQRYLAAFLGGFLLLFGARLAGGCTSGHVISGISQLSLSGLLFGAGVFASGITTAKLLARRN